ncbi:MAG: putative iron binding protein from the HesB_IscA_SufA family [Ignavibacteriae bacterium]|nr:MAG: putative iron binding protein from the HesB_IscA_SufA family [Ignavibacteriota bacterium]
MNNFKSNEVSPVELTDSAVNEINKIKNANNVPENYGLRLGVRSGGCCGLEYILGFENNIQENDKVYESNGIRIIIDNNSLYFLNGAKLDFQVSEFGQGFVFQNLQNDIGNSCDCENGTC